MQEGTAGRIETEESQTEDTESSFVYGQELGKILAVPRNGFNRCPHRALDAEDLLGDVLASERELSTVVAFLARRHADRALSLIPIVPDDVQAIHEQVAGMA